MIMISNRRSSVGGTVVKMQYFSILLESDLQRVSIVEGTGYVTNYYCSLKDRGLYVLHK